MAHKEYSSYRKKVITDYYKNLDTIVLTRLQELVTDLYLAETAAQRTRLWKRVEKSMQKLAIPAPIKDHILSKQDVEILAKNLQQWLRKAT